ncbi:MAG: D-glycero-alpha-D-manno-heptose-1,7-bisphosphate 7-phosphatase [Gemmataceae bacterium]
MRPALFLDRDGVILVEKHYLARPEQVELIDGAAEAIRLANTVGVPVFVVTNQSGVAHGLCDVHVLTEIHAVMETMLAERGARLDGIYSCPHHPNASIETFRQACACRKPAPGMLLQAARDHDLRLAGSFVIGDKLTDLQAGQVVGARGILVRTGHGARQEVRGAWAIVEDLNAAVRAVLPLLIGPGRLAKC